MTAQTNLRNDLAHAVSESIRRLHSASDTVDQAAARLLELNPTDLACLALLSRGEPWSPSALANELGLTRPAITTAVDRLERAGYATRAGDVTDRRAVRVLPTEQAHDRAKEIWGPMWDELEERLSRYSLDELTTILRFLVETREVHLGHYRRVLANATVVEAERTQNESGRRRRRSTTRVG